MDAPKGLVDKLFIALVTALISVSLTWFATAATKADRSDLAALETKQAAQTVWLETKIEAQSIQLTELRILVSKMNGTLEEIQRKMK